MNILKGRDVMSTFNSVSTTLRVPTRRHGRTSWYRSCTLYWRLLPLDSEKCAVVLPFVLDR